ncbi:MAG: hypothetical protein K8R02_06980 [Anaerohalosphaeraceae bacterium]|nr:hypothetical protein [Anaerohalosphaeraceae bacterium]
MKSTINWISIIKYVFINRLFFNIKEFRATWHNLSAPSFPWFYSLLSGILVFLPHLHMTIFLQMNYKEKFDLNTIILDFLFAVFFGVALIIIYNFMLSVLTGIIFKLFKIFSKEGNSRIVYFSAFFQCLMIIGFIVSYLSQMTFNYSFSIMIILPFIILRAVGLFITVYCESNRKILPSLITTAVCVDIWLAIYLFVTAIS